MKSNGARSSYNRYSRNVYDDINRVGYDKYGYNRYNHTSEAFDYAKMTTPPVKKRKVKNNKKVVYSKVKEVAPLSLLKTYGTIAVIFCFVLTLLCLYASNSSLRTNLVELQDRLVATQEDNEYIRVSIDENIDLEKIQAEAMKLGLQLPAEYQIMEINVPKDSYTVQYDSGETKTEEGIWSFFKNIFKG